MKKTWVFCFLATFFLIGGYGLTASADSRCGACLASKCDLDKLAGQPVDIAPWCYEWRADRAVQEKPEACFIPHRLERLDKVYRTAYSALPQDQLKSIYYDMPDLLSPLLPQPTGQLQAGLLWTGGASNYQVQLVWPEGMKQIPPPEAIEVRAYPTSFGWFGWTVDKILSGPELSADRRSWTYKSDPTAKMDTSYSGKVDAATEMVAVFYEKSKAPGCGDLAIPAIHVTGPSMGAWKRMDVDIEWGFKDGAKASDFDGHLEPSIASLGPITPLAEKNGVKVKDGVEWKTRSAKGALRKGISVPVLYAPDSRPGLDSRVSVLTKKGGFTFRVADLDKGPIYVPERGFYITRSGGKTAREFVSELAAKNLKSVREMTREHREAASWDELMREVRLWTCPDGTAVAPYPQVPDPAMQVELPDHNWTEAWRAASNQLTGQHLWGGLGFEVGRVAHEMEMIGLIDPADKVYDHFLKSPGVKSDGDFLDGDGSLEWATAMRHDMGYSHDGTHASTGRLLFAMAERYFLTGDKEWFQQNRARLQAAADWIIRQRANYMKDVPNRKDLQVAGLMPPCMVGDYALPTCDWHWYYYDNVFALQGLQRFADAMKDFDPKTAHKYDKEADSFREDIRRAVDRDATLAPVRLGRDGAYHAYIPRMSYARGLTGPELGAPQFPECDKFMGALALAEPFAVLDAKDPLMLDTMDMMEEMGTTPALVKEKEDARKSKGLSADDAWFWTPYVILPKASHNANVYLLQDDVPSFLRFWMNAYASMVGADGKLWEHWHLGNFDPCSTPDNGTAGWFMENFRDMLTMEEGQSLWIAKATPRAWLEQGKKISVKNAPTYFGTVNYEIASDADNGKISAVVGVPNRVCPKSILLRLRHPKAAPIKSVTVNGKKWNDFDPQNETIKLRGLRGSVKVTANY